MSLLSRISAAAVVLSALPGAAAPNTFRPVLENGVCYGLCGAYGGIGLTGRAEAPDYGASVQPADAATGHSAGGDHVGPCGGAWLTDFDVEITQSCCHMPTVTATSSGAVACVCPMEITCAGMTDTAVTTPAVAAPQTFEVGGAQGWVVKPGNAVYDDIVANVGDVIQFTYSSSYHDVMLVDDSANGCDFTNGQLVDDTGSFAWTIPAAGTFTFSCTRSNHCSSGNQQVTVIAAAAAAPAVCVGDVIADLVIDVNDLLALLSVFGQTGDMPADITGDMLIDVNDLLTLLSQFGNQC